MKTADRVDLPAAPHPLPEHRFRCLACRDTGFLFYEDAEGYEFAVDCECLLEAKLSGASRRPPGYREAKYKTPDYAEAIVLKSRMNRLREMREEGRLYNVSERMARNLSRMVDREREQEGQP